jgi:hypothetical protein
MIERWPMLVCLACAPLTFACARESNCEKGAPAVLVTLDARMLVASEIRMIEVSIAFDGDVRKMDFPIVHQLDGGMTTLAVGLESVVTRAGSLAVTARALDGSGTVLGSGSEAIDAALNACNRVAIAFNAPVATDGGTLDSALDAGTDAAIDAGLDAGTCGPGEMCCGGTCSLVGWWKLDEPATATIAHDSSGHDLNGTLEPVGSGPAWAPDGGRYGGALRFDGRDDYVDLGNPMRLQFRGDLTVAAWVHIDSAVTSTCDQAFVSKRGLGGKRGWELYAQPPGPEWDPTFDVARDANAYARDESNESAMGGTWTHLVGVYRSGAQTLDIYVNGAVTSSTSLHIPTVQFDPNLSVHLGAQAAGPCHFAGALDEVRIYDGALTKDEVMRLP